ncbi:MAG: RteC domain-containing protein [Bacteroidota bacterium]
MHFFKRIKVVPQCYLFYYEKVLSCESFMPPISKKKQRKHLENEMDGITKFFSINSIFINYLRLRRTDLDDRYFVRKYLNDSALVPTNGTQYDPDFNTMRDVLLAKVRASYRYMEYINRSLSELRSDELSDNENQFPVLQFNGNKIDLVELIYALHAAKVFKGNPDISHIQKAVERVFGVELGSIYTRFQQIRNRSGEHIKFLPKLIDAFASLLDDKDGLDLK